MNERMRRRVDMALTQAEAARRAGRSLDTWRKWESDPELVGEESRRRCAAVLHLDGPGVIADPGEGERFDRVWGEAPHITPRQAYAICVELNLWKDLYIGEWLRGPDAPLHSVSPFDELDLRVMMMVGENRAWAAAVGQRCAVVADEVSDGVLPCDRPGPYIDEVLFGAAILTAATWVKDDPSMVEEVPAREAVVDEDDYLIGDDDWDQLEAEFDDRARWGDYDVPLFRGSPMLRPLLDERPPHTWFDPRIEADPALVTQLDEVFGLGK